MDPSGHWGKENEKKVVKDQLQYEYVHQNLTAEAFEKLNAKIKNQVDAVSFENILYGSILPDMYKKMLVFGNYKIKGFSLKKDNMFHGKSRKQLRKLKKKALKKLQKQYIDKDGYVLLGTVLHSIQDYYAHSYVFDLNKYKNNAIKYADNGEKYQKINAYHADWAPYDGVEGRNKVEHKRHKDNPYADFEKGEDGRWGWVDTPREENRRYIKAKKASKTYLRKALKKLNSL